MDIKLIKRLYLNAKPGIIDELAKQLESVSWHDENKIHFLAQVAHESGGFRFVKENLNYSELGLMKTFPKYFNYGGRNPKEYARNPDKIADVVYANRLGNGDVNSHDGSKYRGRGLIQITGKFNYTKCLEWLGVTDPNYLETNEGAVRSAIWFWDYKKLYLLNDVKVITKHVNGGLNGYDDRMEQYRKIRSLLLGLK
jgi:putative chitinase